LRCGRCRRLAAPGRRLGGLGLFGLLGADQPVALGAAADAVSLRLLDARGVAAHADAELLAQLERLLVREPQLSGELVEPDLSSQEADRLSSSDRRAPRPHA